SSRPELMAPLTLSKKLIPVSFVAVLLQDFIVPFLPESYARRAIFSASLTGFPRRRMAPGWSW
ncbi:hypothetical protein, partial [Klebsiella pneumoniae]|uniref:hypothetical protein n=1 Tax=Klebsiella pneumoniae TaxID=573 RepID=UPI00298DDA88